ncbi:MAG TPA: tRNA (N(6)-L-threonylcarbamoyladenosine(37)-C(2))-methylthiotransferase MtaB [Bacteroidia bacterium]|nr:tRNA (N(6)-L-threonylcarbamoyladenosine(37)-C(2))-methylthiotransferase MtaB [Bacteroidia bacterium]
MQIQPTVSFHTLGCKLNFAESSTIGRTLKEAGFEKIDLEDGADVVVINTCSVTENANKECRAIVRKALQYNPESFVAVIGCYAQLKPEEIALMEGVDLVLGATEKFKIQDYLNGFRKNSNAEIHSCSVDDADFFVSSYSLGDRTRAFLKVQDGCDYTCTYCTIPLARGKSRSDSIENVLSNAEKIASKGIKEIVLTGVNIGDFGTEHESHKVNRRYNFLDLIKRLDEIAGIERFRISSIEPNLLNDEIIRFVSESRRFAAHFHIPLQSGSNKILALMRRRYRRELYSERINTIRNMIPDACIGVDVIVGFPGETEEDFLETYNYLNELNISYLHVFTYSERENTEAFSMKGIVPVHIRKQRNKMLRILSEKKLRHFYSTQKGKSSTVLFEADQKNGRMHGFTDNYVKVNVAYDKTLINQLLNVSLHDICDDLSVEAILEKDMRVLIEN